MKKIEYWQFMQWDGGDRHYTKSPCFFNEEDAKEFLGNNKYDFFDKKTLYIYDSVDDYVESTAEETKQKALAKLTDEEKKALGLI